MHTRDLVKSTHHHNLIDGHYFASEFYLKSELAPQHQGTADQDDKRFIGIRPMRLRGSGVRNAPATQAIRFGLSTCGRGPIAGWCDMAADFHLPQYGRLMKGRQDGANSHG